MKRKSFENYFVIGLAIFLLIIVFGIVFVLLNPATLPSPRTLPKATPTPFPTLTQEENAPDQPVLYNPRAEERLLNKLQNRQKLSDEDGLAKANILSALPGDKPSGVLYQTENVILDYTYTADEIQGEIITTNIDQAKAEALVWLRSKGLSEQGICNLPVSFYLSFDIAQQLKGKTLFNSLPAGC